MSMTATGSLGEMAGRPDMGRYYSKGSTKDAQDPLEMTLGEDGAFSSSLQSRWVSLTQPFPIALMPTQTQSIARQG